MSALQATAQNSRLVNGRSKCPRPWPDFPNSRTEQRIGEKEQHGAERQDPLDAALLREHSPGEADHTDQERPDHEAARHRRPVLPPHNPSTTGHERQAETNVAVDRPAATKVAVVGAPSSSKASRVCIAIIPSKAAPR